MDNFVIAYIITTVTVVIWLVVLAQFLDDHSIRGPRWIERLWWKMVIAIRSPLSRLRDRKLRRAQRLWREQRERTEDQDARNKVTAWLRLNGDRIVRPETDR